MAALRFVICASPQCRQTATGWGYWLGKSPSLVCDKHGKLALYTQPIYREVSGDE